MAQLINTHRPYQGASTGMDHGLRLLQVAHGQGMNPNANLCRLAWHEGMPPNSPTGAFSQQP
jgi:hypothetical protein